MQSGRALEKLEADHCIYHKQMVELKRKTQRLCCEMTWQTILNLRGRSKDPLVFTGDAMDEEEMFETLSQPGYSSVHRCFSAWRMMIYVLFGEHERAVELAQSEGDGALQSNPGCK